MYGSTRGEGAKGHFPQSEALSSYLLSKWQKSPIFGKKMIFSPSETHFFPRCPHEQFFGTTTLSITKFDSWSQTKSEYLYLTWLWFSFYRLEREKDRLRGDYTHLKEDYTSLKEDYSNLKSTFSELEGLHRNLVTENVSKPSKNERGTHIFICITHWHINLFYRKVQPKAFQIEKEQNVSNFHQKICIIKTHTICAWSCGTHGKNSWCIKLEFFSALKWHLMYQNWSRYSNLYSIWKGLEILIIFWMFSSISKKAQAAKSRLLMCCMTNA